MNPIPQTYLLSILTLLFFLAIANPVFSQASIQGKAEGQPGELVRVIVYADQFSLLEKTLASTKTDENGNFQINPDINETTFAYIGVGLKKAEFYLKPEAKYIFNILPEEKSQTGSIFDKLPLQLTYEAKDNGLSEAIAELNVESNRFIYDNADKIYRGRDKSIINTFRENIELRFKDFNDPYFNDYIRYLFASLEWISKMKNEYKIVQEYFLDQPVLYQNIQYTEFFNELFKSYFGYNQVFSYDELVEAINYGDGIASVFNLLMRDTLFVIDAEIRELVAIHQIVRKYFSSDIKKDRVIKLLLELQTEGSSAEIKNIAGNYITKLKKLEQGSRAPEFSLENSRGEKVGLKELEGRHLILGFIEPDCKMCLEHFKLLDGLEKQFPGYVRNVTIVYGKSYSEVIKYASDRNFDWPILKLDDDILLLEANNIRTYPSYLLINPDGTIGMATAPMPDENLELYIMRQISVYKKKHENDTE